MSDILSTATVSYYSDPRKLSGSVTAASPEEAAKCAKMLTKGCPVSWVSAAFRRPNGRFLVTFRGDLEYGHFVKEPMQTATVP